MIVSRKKQLKSYDDLLAYYSAQTQRTLQKYYQIMSEHGTTSINILNTQFNTYKIAQKLNKGQTYKLGDYCQIDENTLKYHNLSPHQKLPHNHLHQYYDHQYDHQQYNSKIKPVKNQNYLTLTNKKTKGKDYSVEKLSKKMKKMSIKDKEIKFDDEAHWADQSDMQDVTLNYKYKPEDNNLLQKELKTILAQSAKKQKTFKENPNLFNCQQQISLQNQLFEAPLSDGDSVYNMTDYSSNQSSNEGEYETHFSDEEPNQPLFGGLFQFHKLNQLKMPDNGNKNCFIPASSSQSSSNSLQFNLKSKELLKSPKKTQKKRLYIGEKKIPRWAENLEQISHQSKKWNQNDALKIYGVCRVEDLNTNLIFGLNGDIDRTSSAKWARNGGFC